MSEEDRIKAGITEVNIANIDHFVLGYSGLIDLLGSYSPLSWY